MAFVSLMVVLCRASMNMFLVQASSLRSGERGHISVMKIFLLFFYSKVRAYLIVVGFTLVFGGMLSKTWRVYKIFTNRRLKRQV